MNDNLLILNLLHFLNGFEEKDFNLILPIEHVQVQCISIVDEMKTNILRTCYRILIS